jgi:transcription termination factor Rho
VSAPKAGKTMVLAAIAAALAASDPEVHLMMVLVGERPEEVTDLKESVPGEVIYSTFDQSAADHIMVAELAIERAKRLVEAGRDVVVLLDSIARLARAYNLAAPASSRILAGGVAHHGLAAASQIPRGRAEHQGGRIPDDSVHRPGRHRLPDGRRVLRRIKGTGNMELRLRRDLADKRIFPAVDIAPSGTRRDELLIPDSERAAIDCLRRALAGLDAQQALKLLLDRTASTPSNREFLEQIIHNSARPAPRRSAPSAHLPDRKTA